MTKINTPDELWELPPGTIVATRTGSAYTLAIHPETELPVLQLSTDPALYWGDLAFNHTPPEHDYPFTVLHQPTPAPAPAAVTTFGQAAALPDHTVLLDMAGGLWGWANREVRAGG